MNVVLYMRYSSDRQTEQSIEGQDRVCSEFCKAKGYNIVARYIDRATSAYKDTSKRTEFMRMIRDSERGLWQGVVVYKLDRFARNRYDSATYKAKLKKNGVNVISATENISDNPEGVILEAVLEGMAEFYSKELSQKITRGMIESAHKCNSTGGHIPLGYKIVNKKYVVDEPSAQIVREAFDLYASGKTVSEICRIFNEKGYRTAKHAKFNKNSFYTIFRNERYIGVYKYQGIRKEDGIPPIVPKETFDKVQTMIRKNGQAPSRSKAKVEYLLAQKLFCGHCGANMVGESGRSHTGEVHYYYTCAARKKSHSCDKKPLQKEFIESAVVKDAVSFLTKENIETLAEMAIAQNRADIETESLIPALEAELKEIHKRINNIVKLVEEGAASATLVSRLSELEDQKRDCEKRLADASADIIILEKEHIVFWLEKFAQGDINDPAFRRDLVELLVNSVTVWDEPDGWYRITTTYNLTSVAPTTYKVKAGDRSDLNSIIPPLRYNPNFAFFFGTIFGQTTRHRQG